MALARAANLQAKREKNPSTARQRSATDKAKYAHKCATAGNFSKVCKIVRQEMIPACSDDTVEKLRDLHPERSLNLNMEKLPTPESLNAFWNGEEGTALRNKIFSVTKVRKYIRNCQALGAPDIDGWRGREHVLYLFTNNDTELHQLIIDELLFPDVTGEFLSFSAPTCGGPFVCVSQKRWRYSPSSVWVNLAQMRS
jgi:hypothetical protein